MVFKTHTKCGLVLIHECETGNPCNKTRADPIHGFHGFCICSVLCKNLVMRTEEIEETAVSGLLAFRGQAMTGNGEPPAGGREEN